MLTLFQDQRVKMRNPEQFVKTAIDLFYKEPDFLTLMNTLDREVIGKPYLLQTPIDAVSIGIFNYWFSTGPIDPLWKAGDKYSEDTIQEKIIARPDIQKTRLNFQGLFFKFNVCTCECNGDFMTAIESSETAFRARKRGMLV